MARGMAVMPGGDIDFANIVYAVFEASGMFYVPDYLREIDAFLVQGGQGGGSEMFNGFDYPNGTSIGGVGGYRRTYKKVKVTPGAILPVTVGGGGSYGKLAAGNMGRPGDQGGHSTIGNTGAGTLTSSGGIRGASSGEHVQNLRPFDDWPPLKYPIASGGSDIQTSGNSSSNSYETRPYYPGIGSVPGGGTNRRGTLPVDTGLGSFMNYNINTKYLLEAGYGCGGAAFGVGISNFTPDGALRGTPGIVIIRYYKEEAA